MGDVAPDFELGCAEGHSVRLYEALNHSTVVLFFYLQNFTPVCMAEVCSFRNHVEDFRRLNARVYGISPGGDFLTKRFAAYHKLPFPLLVDRGGRVRKLYGVPKLLGFLPGRSTYVIGQNRKVLQITSSGLASELHTVEPLNLLRREAGA